jgi:hypothetical protein
LRTKTGGYVWQNRVLTPHVTVSGPASSNESVPASNVIENDAVNSNEPVPASDADPGWLFWFGAAAVVTAVGALIVYAVSGDPTNSPDNKLDAEADPQTSGSITLKRGELLAVDIRLSSPEADPWEILESSDGALVAEIVDALESSIGPGIDFMIICEKGSIRAKIIAKVKVLWEKVEINIEQWKDIFASVFENFTKRTGTIIKCPQVKQVWKVIKSVASFSSSIVSILNFFDIPDAADFGERIRHWIFATDGMA